MSKVDTLLKLIAYQKQHPTASAREIARAIGISPKHLWQLKGEVNLLQHALSESPPEGDAFGVEAHPPLHREASKPHGQPVLPELTGQLRLARPGEQPPYGWLTIGEVIESGSRASSVLHPALDFWLRYLCYETLVWCRRDGSLECRLATAIEPLKGFSEWRITLRRSGRWSDGTPLSPEDVKATLLKSPLAPRIAECQNDGPTQLRLRLKSPEPLLPLHLSGIPIGPAHSSVPFLVISGAYRLKRFRQKADIFRLERRRDDANAVDGGIDLITIKPFKRYTNAIKAVCRQEVDVLPLRALMPLYQTTLLQRPQQMPWGEDSYYVLFLNRRRHTLHDEKNCLLLQAAISASAITRYLHPGQFPHAAAMRPPSGCPLDLKIACDIRECSVLAYLIGKVVGASLINPVFHSGNFSYEDLKQNADAFLTQLCLGMGFFRLSQYFHSEGKNNPFAYANPQVDSMLSQLDQTADLAKRQAIGRHVLSLLQADFAVIVLSPCYQYLLSPLHIQFDDNLTYLFDFVKNMSRLVVDRRPRR